jgi:hypothetical protein
VGVPIKTSTARGNDPVVQFSVFAPNQVGRLFDLITLLAGHAVHVLALTVLDTTDSTILRLVADDPDRARDLLQEHNFAFTECEILAVEMDAATQFKEVLAALLEAEINIYYVYSFLTRPEGKLALALSVEDREIAAHALTQHRFKVLRQGDVAR